MHIGRSLLILLFGLLYVSIMAQESYRLRLALSQIDTATKTACYDLQMSNGGTEEWYLGNSNIFVFYDFSVACFLPEQSSLVLDDLIYDLNDLDRNSNKVDSSQFPLPYEETLGTIRAGFSTNLQGALMDTLGTWVSTVELCFLLNFDDITDPNTCFIADFITPEIELLLPVRDIVQQFDPNVFIADVPRDTAFNLRADGTKTTCFILEEDSVELCSDGIDNDEDGLIDCDDTSACAPENPSININAPGGCDDRPSLIRINGITGNASYSLDGITFQEDSIFNDLPAGDYEIFLQKNGISECMTMTFVRLEQEECRENDDVLCTDGIDNDDDGLVDCQDMDCLAIITELNLIEPVECPELSDGAVNPVIASSGAFQISIDSGMTYLELDQATNLQPGDYQVFMRNIITGCITQYDNNPVTIVSNITCPVEAGFCADGIDNDDDGLVDCLDPECFTDVLCGEFPEYYIPNAIYPFSTGSNNSFGVFINRSAIVTIDELSIYDRWGNQVYGIAQTAAQNNSRLWDGTYQNQFVSPGVYVYKGILSAGALSEQVSGNISVIY